MADPIIVSTAVVPAREDGTKADVRVSLVFYSDGSVKWEPAK